MKLLPLLTTLAALAALSASAAPRKIVCSEPELPLNEIGKLEIDMDRPNAGKIMVSRWNHHTANASGRIDPTDYLDIFSQGEYGQEEVFNWGEVPYVARSPKVIEVIEVITLVRKAKVAGNDPEFVLRTNRMVKIGGENCVPNEDQGCTVKQKKSSDVAILCTDSYDVTVKPDPTPEKTLCEREPYHCQ